MNQTDLARFRRMCGQFRWLAVFMVVTVGAVVALMFGAPTIVALRGGPQVPATPWLAYLPWALPSAFYLFAVWSIGSAMGQLANGRLIQPTLARALRRVGLALGFGGVISVFGVTNMVRLLTGEPSAYLNFDVAGMTLGMIGGALFLLGRVMDQAGQIQAELDEMI